MIWRACSARSGRASALPHTSHGANFRLARTRELSQQLSNIFPWPHAIRACACACRHYCRRSHRHGVPGARVFSRPCVLQPRCSRIEERSARVLLSEQTRSACSPLHRRRAADDEAPPGRRAHPRGTTKLEPDAMLLEGLPRLAWSSAASGVSSVRTPLSSQHVAATALMPACRASQVMSRMRGGCRRAGSSHHSSHHVGDFSSEA